jgi:hypothetical protein
MECNFYMGQKVVCVKAPKARRAYKKEIIPVEKEVYTVRDIICYGDKISIRLEEIINDVGMYVFNGHHIATECSFNHNLFKPLTDISIFHKIVSEVKNREHEYA